MKKILMVSLLILSVRTAEAQELVWNTDIDKAIEISEETKKPLMLFFTGSDWCGWCKRLQDEVFQKPEFANWAKDSVVLMEVDFPRRTPLAPELQEQNNQLQQFFGIQGYPTIWFVIPTKKDGRINFEKLGSTGYLPGGPTAWLDAANRILKNK
jgi:thioredoxin-related protein